MKNRNVAGFTIAEMAVVVVIMAVVMTSSMKLLNTQVTNAAIQQTRDKQAEIRQALLQFMRSNGRLPCPDTKLSPLGPDGVEVAPCNTNIVDGFGVVPWQTLGLGRDRAVDGWGNFMSYRVANGFFAGLMTTDWTSKTGVNLNANTFSILEWSAPQPNIVVQERSPIAPFPLVNVTTPGQAVVVLLSHGKSSGGAVKQNGVSEAVSFNADEALNATAPFTPLVTRPLTLWPWDPAGAGSFDDVLSYMLPSDLFSPLGKETSLLGNCLAYCAAPGAGCAFTGVPVGRDNGVCP